MLERKIKITHLWSRSVTKFKSEIEILKNDEKKSAIPVFEKLKSELKDLHNLSI